MPKVLLVDDVAIFLEMQRIFLRDSAVCIFTAKDGIEALELASKNRPGLIFMDLHMPKMNGAECCALIKQDPLLRSVPVVMVTAEGKEPDRSLCFKAGCDEFLTKPIDRNIYLETARKYMSSIDRRYPRVPCRAELKLRINGQVSSGEIRDISLHGLYVATDYKVDVETMLELAFALHEADSALVQIKGRVAWVNSKKNVKKPDLPVGFGVEFIAMTKNSKQILNYFVETRRQENHR
jgi:CheY-like chemotaxis protein